MGKYEPAALALGIDPASDYNCTRGQFDTHDHYLIDFLSQGENNIAYRVQDQSVGQSWTKIADDNEIAVDAAQVDAVWAEVMRIQVLKNATVMGLIASTVPDATASPNFSVDDNEILVIDLSAFTSDEQAAITAAITASGFAAQVSIAPIGG